MLPSESALQELSNENFKYFFQECWQNFHTFVEKSIISPQNTKSYFMGPAPFYSRSNAMQQAT
jgi:hypothetical protein